MSVEVGEDLADLAEHPDQPQPVPYGDDVPDRDDDRPVEREQVSLYGIVATDPPIERDGRQIYRIRDLVEKPSPEEAPSTLAVVGRYVLPGEIFDYLERTEPGRGGEIQLTDALRQLAKERGLWAVVCEGKSYDAGDKLGFLQATVEIAMENPEFGEAFRTWLRSLKA